MLPAIHPTVIARREPNLLVPNGATFGQLQVDRTWLNQSALWVHGARLNDPSNIVTAVTSSPSYGMQMHGYGIRFDGVDDVIDIENGVEGNYLNKSFFVSFSTERLSTTQYIVSSFNNDNDRFFIGTDSANNILIRFGGSAQLASTPTVQVNKIINVAGAVSAGSAVIYINGARYSYSYTGAPGDTAYATIGAYERFGLAAPLQGTIYFFGSHNGIVPEHILRSFTLNKNSFLTSANSTPYLISVPTGGATYTETHNSSAIAASAITESWSLNYAATHAAASAASSAIAHAYETPSVAYDEAHAASAVASAEVAHTWALNYPEAHAAAAVAGAETAHAWALNYPETHATSAVGRCEIAAAYQVGNDYSEAHAVTAVAVATLAHSYSAQYSEAHAVTALAGCEISAAWALNYAAAHAASAVAGSAIAAAYATPAPGEFDEAHAAASIAGCEIAHTFSTPAAIGRILNPTLRTTGTRRTLRTTKLIN